MRIAIVGKGRLARTLAPVLTQAGHDVTLSGRGETVPEACDLRWLLVPDHAIATVAQSLPLGAPIAHASGASTLEPLAPHVLCGSLHPLMTFPGPEISVPPLHETPAAIDASTPALHATLTGLARDMGLKPFSVPGDRRLYHAAAVIAGNFATVLLAEAADVLTHAGLPREQAATLLLPLALQSLRNAGDDPAKALTGPIARGDAAVLDAHRQALEAAGSHAMRELYDLLVQHAMQLQPQS